ncbi:MAG TPA: hypothetical protein VF553_13120 [Pyrinomonadaceae bacterium]|jgi:hypothetical protein
MRNIYSILSAALLTVLLLSTAFGQRPRNVSDPSPSPSTAPASSSTASRPAPAPAPQTVNANYEGGVFGYNKKINGTISFDDTNERLLFRNKQRQEVLFIPYRAILSAFADVKSKRPIAADVAARLSIFALPGLLIKKKFRYLTMQYRDPDTNAEGITSFKLENKQILESVLNTLASKAGLSQRGEIYVRRKDPNDQP